MILGLIRWGEGTPHIRIGWDTAHYSESGGTPHKKMCSNIYTGVGTPHITPHTTQNQGGTQSEFPTNETLVGFGDSSGVGFEKVEGFFLIFYVAMDIWISKLDFHMYPQQPPKLSNQNEAWKSSKITPLCVYLDFPFVLPGTSKSDHCQKQCTMYIFSEISIEISQFLCLKMVY